MQTKRNAPHILGFALLPALVGCGAFASAPAPPTVDYTTFHGVIASSDAVLIGNRPSGVIDVYDATTQTSSALEVPAPGLAIWEGSIALSPDGTRIAYAAMVLADGGYELFVLDRTSGSSLQITHDRAHHHAPVWSHDGKTLFYTVYDGTTDTAHAIDADGTNERTLPLRGEVFGRVAISPSGDRIAYQGGVGQQTAVVPGIYTCRLDGTDLQPVLFSDADRWVYGPAWSPDGSRIALIAMHDPNNQRAAPYFFDLVTIAPDGTNAVTVVHWPFEGYPNAPYPVWSPDGKQLLIDALTQGQPKVELHVVDLNGTVTRLTHGGAYNPSWVQ